MVDEKKKRDRVTFEMPSGSRILINKLMESGEYVTEAELMRKALGIGLRLIKKARDGDVE